MMSRVLCVIALLLASMPASAQSRVATLKAAADVREAFLSPRGDRIAASVGQDRIAIWSLPDGKLLQDLKLAQRPVSMLFAGTDQVIVALADGGIEVRTIATGAAVRRMDAGVRQPVLAGERGWSVARVLGHGADPPVGCIGYAAPHLRP